MYGFALGNDHYTVRVIQYIERRIICSDTLVLMYTWITITDWISRPRAPSLAHTTLIYSLSHDKYHSFTDPLDISYLTTKPLGIYYAITDPLDIFHAINIILNISYSITNPHFSTFHIPLPTLLTSHTTSTTLSTFPTPSPTLSTF